MQRGGMAEIFQYAAITVLYILPKSSLGFCHDLIRKYIYCFLVAGYWADLGAWAWGSFHNMAQTTMLRRVFPDTVKVGDPANHSRPVFFKVRTTVDGQNPALPIIRNIP